MKRPARILLVVIIGAAALGSLALSASGRPHSGGRVANSQPTQPQADPRRSVECSNGVVVSVSASGSDVGVSILQQGGNAVDAAVATAFAMAAAYPAAGNIGGGGFMLIHPAPGEGDPVAINYRETAPAAACPTMYAKDESQFTRRAVAVPGTVRGMALAHRRFGTRPWPELLAPAVRLARDGFVVGRIVADSLNEILGKATPEDFPELYRVFGRPGGGRWQPSDRLVQPDLARTLQLLADLGPDAFYTGPIAEQIVAEMARGDGLITLADLAACKAVECKPLTMRYHGLYDVYVPPPPSSGGVCLIEELNMLEAFDLKAWGRWSPTTLHVMAEIMRRANYDRARYLGDPAFVQIPENLTDPQYARELAQTINLNQATSSTVLNTEIPLTPEEDNTTHFSVIDHRGMAVSNTYTLERLWGSRIVVRNMGFLLNNQMWAFNLFPGVTDTSGAVGTAPNTIAPGKRPISSQTPTIVARDGEIRLVTGSPGTRAIPHTVLCLLVNVFDFQMPLQQAIDSPRLSQEWFPDQISFETPERYPELMGALKKLGHSVVRTGPRPQGSAHSIWVAEPHHYIGVADQRRGGTAAGY